MKTGGILLKNEDDMVLLSLREEYYANILSGQKRYEYRKIYRRGPTKAVIYISKTQKSIVSIIEFDSPIIAKSEKISAIAESEQAGSYDSMMEYLGENSVGYAIPVKKIYKLKESIPLHTLRQELNFVPPQSYAVIKKDSEIMNFLNNIEVESYQISSIRS